MKILITGTNGTIGVPMVRFYRDRNMEVISWDRRKIPIDDYSAMESFLKDVNPDILLHLAFASNLTGKENEPWLVNYQWTSELAWLTRILGIKFVYTSTAMVFSPKNQGPFTLHSVPDAEEEYGFTKRKSEERVFYQNPASCIIRLGWQIGSTSGSNNMVDYLEKQMTENGKIKASIHWYPACSFLEDTIMVMDRITEHMDPGLYMIDSNEKWNFFEIVTALKLKHNDKWIIEAATDTAYDQRLIDKRVNAPSLKQRLNDLP